MRRYRPIIKALAIAWLIHEIKGNYKVNFIALLALSPKVIKILKDYERQKKLDVDPVFEPTDLGLQHAELWTEIISEKYSDLLEAKHAAERASQKQS